MDLWPAGRAFIVVGGSGGIGFAAARLPYASFKSGVATFTKGIAKAYGADGVRANCVCPGAIETAALRGLRERLAAERGVPPKACSKG